MALLSYVSYFRLDFGRALASILAQSFFADSFSAENLPFGLGEVLGAGFSRTVIDLSLLIVLSAIAAARAGRTMRVLDRERLDWNSTEMSWFAIGGIVIIACFFAGQNVDYRGIYFLFLVPGLVYMRRSAREAVVRLLCAQIIVAVLLVMWEEFSRRALHLIAGPISNEGLSRPEVFFWIGRELVWWWLIAGLAAIVLTYLRQLPVPNDIIVRFARRAILDKI
jgi:hypothetical protein